MSDNKAKKEREQETIITVKTIPTTPARAFEGKYRDYIITLRADAGNAGNIYVGKSAMTCTFPFDADDSQLTWMDLDKLWWYSDNGTEKMHVWAELDKRLASVYKH